MRTNGSDSRSPIVVGLDGSAGASAALAWAVDEARRRRAPLRLVHAVDLSSTGRWHDVMPSVDAERGMAWSIITTALVDLEDVDLQVQTHLDVGDVSTVLLEQAREAQLLVLGARGQGQLVELLLGSRVLRMASYAACPVVVVRPGWSEPVDIGTGRGNVVVGVDGSEQSEAAVAFAFEEADLRGATLTAVHAWSPPSVAGGETSAPLWELAEQDEWSLLGERLAGWSAKYPDVVVDRHVRRADAALVLVEESYGAALTVVGSRGLGTFASAVLGSVSHALLHHARSPLAIVRTW